MVTRLVNTHLRYNWESVDFLCWPCICSIGSNQIVYPFNFITHSSCLQIAKAFGASDIIVMDVRDEKLQKAKTFGATHTVNSAKEDPIEKILLCAFLYMYLSWINIC